MNFIEKAQEAYYSGSPIISDEQYDELIRIGKAEETIGPKGDFKHPFPMWSLQKKYPGRGDKLPTNLEDYVETPKLDGNAVALVYVATNSDTMTLQTFATRGDGRFGKLINLAKVDKLGIPREIARVKGGTVVQITGEVVATKAIDNARNIVSGAINLDSLGEFNERVERTRAVFAAYGIEGLELDSYKQALNLLDEQGFIIPVDSRLKEAPTDGIVWRLNDNAKFIEQGYTAKAPRASFAVKEDEDYVVSTLLQVVWATGRSGKVTPTGIIETVNIGGANISRATLNNPTFIKEMGLKIGSKVKVIRAGEIIPQIVGVL